MYVTADGAIAWYIFIVGTVYLAQAIGFGIGTMAVATHKGYSGNWFWFGFFCGVVGLIVAACIQPTAREMGRRMEMYAYSSTSSNTAVTPGSWACKCGRINASYTGTCVCGRTKPDTPGATVYLQKVEANQWQCPHCGKVNLRYITSCTCGCTIQQADEIKRRQLEEMKKHDEIAKKEYQEERVKEENNLEHYRNLGLEGMDLVVVKLLSRGNTRFAFSEMCYKLPRSTNIKEFKDSVEKLEQSHVIEKDEDGKYFLAIRFDGASDNEVEITESQGNAGVPNASAENEDQINTESSDKFREIRELKVLLDEGIISQSDFDQKKKELLGL